ncbi:ATP-dependent nuclease [Flectobacillus roseus]|uniref:AAA family ATPase n=1 Tax=Flectobacillus roseus TaxID=502259 RepID=A0ABT6Y350_9BACT|nr:AAA family ATPase [Flectobacillus roseus]MDI9857976.1 AAA family ATPase [Flectobacillus roseus]
MIVSKIKLDNIRGFKGSTSLEFSENINVFCGLNNSGKSTILESISCIDTNVFNSKDLYFSTSSGSYSINIQLNQNESTKNLGDNSSLSNQEIKSKTINIECLIGGMQNIYTEDNVSPSMGMRNGAIAGKLRCFFSERKLRKLQTNVEYQRKFGNDNLIESLTDKIDRIRSNPHTPELALYSKMCLQIFGYEILTGYIDDNKTVVVHVDSKNSIPIVKMGEGVISLAILIVELCSCKGGVFLIEEPENDIHPQMLKILLNLIIESSKLNQFFISTHSNIVLKVLGSEVTTSIYKVKSKKVEDGAPHHYISTIQKISTTDERKILLEELGYELFDYDLWEGWIFFEEYSAEGLIRDYFIPWYVPKLHNKIRTFSARTSNQVAPKFDEFNRLFVYLHLELVYKNKVWVIIDGGDEELKIINEFKDKYVKQGWNPEQFLQLKKHDFEEYYPEKFVEKFRSEILPLKNSNSSKRDKKKELLDEVREWIKNDEINAKLEFEKSAFEIIEVLKIIETGFRVK